MEHLEDCAMGHPNARVCDATGGAHRWAMSWPGNFCLECGSEDPMEQCVSGCTCPCHEAFWAEYEAATGAKG